MLGHPLASAVDFSSESQKTVIVRAIGYLPWHVTPVVNLAPPHSCLFTG